MPAESKLSEEEWSWAQEQYESGEMSSSQIAKYFGVQPSTISRHIKLCKWGASIKAAVDKGNFLPQFVKTTFPASTKPVAKEAPPASKASPAQDALQGTLPLSQKGSVFLETNPRVSKTVDTKLPIGEKTEDTELPIGKKTDELPPDEEAAKQEVLASHKSFCKAAREKVLRALSYADANDVTSLKNVVMAFKYVQACERLAYGMKDAPQEIFPPQNFTMSWEGTPDNATN